MKLAEISISNFRGIGSDGVRIKLDNIVVLIGPNNVGKSTVLDAYSKFRENSALEQSDFHGNGSTPVTIEALLKDITESDSKKIIEKWVFDDESYGKCTKVKYVWGNVGQKGQKYTWNPAENDWTKGGSGGIDSLLQSCLPVPIRINPLDEPKTYESVLASILIDSIKTSLKQDDSRLSQLSAELERLTQSLHLEIEQEITEACDKISSQLSLVFPGYNIEFSPAPGNHNAEKILGAGSVVNVINPNGDNVPLVKQGTGLQRAFLWSAVKALVELGKHKHNKKNITPEEPRILLIDEPESFLHPHMVRLARESLYDLATLPGWQVMITTHSPVFVDMSKPHTTIIRVGGDETGMNRTYECKQDKFDSNEWESLKMIRACNPFVNEFFFADHVILVEGETEHLVLSHLLELKKVSSQEGVHILNCMGKANIPLFAKVLNQFGTPYTILHDVDTPRVFRTDKWIRNGMWTMNHRIREVVDSRAPDLPQSQVIVHIPDFEGHYFKTKAKTNKPQQAMKVLMSTEFKEESDYADLHCLLDQIINKNHPFTCKSKQQLHAFIKAATQDHLLPNNDAWLLEDSEVF